MAGVGKVVKSLKVPPSNVAPNWMRPLCRWAYKLSNFGRMGVYTDDILIVTPEIEEALERLPKDILEARNFRITRALYLSTHKEYLPESEQHTWDDDYKYLAPYVEMVRKEKLMQEAWTNIEDGKRD